MTDEQIKQNAEAYAIKICEETPIDYRVVSDAYFAGAHSRDEEIGRMNTTIRLYANQIALLRKEIDQLRNPWISVEDRLPEDNKTVLVWFGGYYMVAVLRDNEWWDCTGYQTGGGWSALDKIPDIASSYITHWMPIPQIKKGE